MIDLQTKIHDKFTLEFKAGFNAETSQTNKKYSDFLMNTWIFVPNSLDINKAKYSKDDFYRDIKSSVRLITPSYQLHELANETSSFPHDNLLKHSLKIGDTESNNELLHALKMYCAIVKSATRDAFKAIASCKDADQMRNMAEAFLSDAPKAIERYRDIYNALDVNTIEKNLAQAFSYGDEFLSNILEQYGYRLRDFMRLQHPTAYQVLESRFKEVLQSEKAYKQAKGYLCVKSDDDNTEFVFHASLLKKFAESDLFLEANKSQSTFLIEQILYSAAAGVAMIFATVASFFFQQRYGNFTFPFLVALVISYMFKDRLKDWLRVLFASRVSPKIYDTKTKFRINEQEIGWSKDSFDFVSNEEIPDEVLHARARSPLFTQASGEDEKIILYRKKVRLFRKQLDIASPFPLEGINDHIRFNVTEYLRKMDNPRIPLLGAWEDQNYAVLTGAKSYFLHFVIQCVYDGQTEYKHIAVICNREGILDVKDVPIGG